MESSAKVTLFEDIFEITALNPDGYKFDRVNRIQATGTTFECDLLLDINCEIYTLRDNEKVTLVLGLHAAPGRLPRRSLFLHHHE